MTSPEQRIARAEQVRESMRASANHTRDLADEMAAGWKGCDDPMHPHQSVTTNGITDWSEFVRLVARPIVELADDLPAVQPAMHLYRMVSPLYISAAMVMMDNRLSDAAALVASLRAEVAALTERLTDATKLIDAMLCNFAIDVFTTDPKKWVARITEAQHNSVKAAIAELRPTPARERKTSEHRTGRHAASRSDPVPHERMGRGV